MQLPEDCARTRSPPPPLCSLSPLSLALCLAGFSPGQAQSKSGPVGTSYSTTSVTFCRKDWAWTSWAWTYTTAAVSSKRSTSMSGWVFKREERRWPSQHSGSHRVFLSDSCTLDCFATALEFNNNLQRHALSLARISSRKCTDGNTSSAKQIKCVSPQCLSSQNGYIPSCRVGCILYWL